MLKICNNFSNALTCLKLGNHKKTPNKNPAIIEFPKELLAEVSTLLPLKFSLQEVGRLTRVSKATAGNDQIWRLVAQQLGISLNDYSTLRPKKQIEKAFIKAFDFGTINLFKNKMFVDKSMLQEFSTAASTNCITHIPEGYFLKFYANFGSERIIYRDENKNIKDIISPGREKKEWEKGEKEEWVSVIKTMKQFEIIEFVPAEVN